MSQSFCVKAQEPFRLLPGAPQGLLCPLDMLGPCLSFLYSLFQSSFMLLSLLLLLGPQSPDHLPLQTLLLTFHTCYRLT